MMRLAETLLRLRHLVWVLGVLIVGASVWKAKDLEFNYSFWTLFVSNDPEVVKLQAYAEQWGEDSALVFVVLRSKTGDVFTLDNLRIVDRIENAAAKLPGVEDATSVLSVVTVQGHDDELLIGPLAESVPTTQAQAGALGDIAVQSSLLSGSLISANKRTTLVPVRIENDLRDAADRNPVVEALRTLAEDATAGSDLQSYLTGIPVAQWVYSDKMVRDLRTFTSISAALLALILVVMFRSATGLLLPMAVVSSATVMTLATMVVTGEQVNMINTAIPTLMMVIGIADGIHLMSDYRQRLAAGESVRNAVLQTLRYLGWSCFLTSLTTAVGFASLWAARIATVKHFGLYAGIGIVYAFVANIVIIPIGLYVLKPKTGFEAAERHDTPMTRGLLSLSHWVVAHPWRALTVSVAVLVLAVVGTLQVEIESRMFEEVADDDPVVRAHRKLEEDLPGIVSYALDVYGEPDAVTRPEVLLSLQRLAEMAEAHPAVDRAMGLPDLLSSMHRASHGGDPSFERVPESPALIAQYLMLAEGEATERLLDPERRRTQIWMRGPEVVSSIWEDLRSKLEAEIAGMDLSGVRIVVTGSSSMAQRALGSIVRDVLTSLLGASLIIFVVMSLLFRSLRVGLVSMIPNLIPLVVTVGVMGWLGIHLRTSTVVIFSISLGLAVDDTIHFMVRYGRERAAGAEVHDAIHSTLHKTGRPIVYTSLLLMGGFWILLLSSFNATRDIGLLGGVTLVSALFADLLVLPALLVLLPRIGRESSDNSHSPPSLKDADEPVMTHNARTRADLPT